MMLHDCHPERRVRFIGRWMRAIAESASAEADPTAFSIVELLVVLAIVAILASIFIPYLATVRESERRVRCADNLRLVMQALHNYASLKDRQGVTSHDYPSVVYDAAR